MPFPIEEQWIEETERKLGVRFPDSYRVSMKRLNGGEIKAAKEWWTLHPILDKSDLKRIKRTCNDVVHETTYHKSWPGFPENACAIAANGYGDQLIFLSSHTSPTTFDRAVYYWNHETREVNTIAEDFADLRRK